MLLTSLSGFAVHLRMMSGTYTLICIVSVVVNALTYYYYSNQCVSTGNHPKMHCETRETNAPDNQLRKQGKR